jgi:hypothetical protein
MDSSALRLSPNKSIRLVRPQAALMVVMEESQETLAGIDLTPHHFYNRYYRRPQPQHQHQGSCLADHGNPLGNNSLNKPVLTTSTSITKQVQGPACHSRSTSMCNTSKSNQKRTVRFNHDYDHRVHDHCSISHSRNSLLQAGVQVEVHPIEPISRKYRDQLYWTEPQLLQIHGDAKRVVKHYAASKRPYVAAIHRILQSQRSIPTSTGNGPATTTTTAATPHTSANDVAQVLVESAARGLEARIVPVLKYYRKRTVRAVLALQCHMRKTGEHADMAVHLLRRKSLQASRPCRHLARQLALGDAAAAGIDSSGPAPSPVSSSSSVSVLPNIVATTIMPTPSVWLQEQHSTIVEP